MEEEPRLALSPFTPDVHLKVPQVGLHLHTTQAILKSCHCHHFIIKETEPERSSVTSCVIWMLKLKEHLSLLKVPEVSANTAFALLPVTDNALHP